MKSHIPAATFLSSAAWQKDKVERHVENNSKIFGRMKPQLRFQNSYFPKVKFSEFEIDKIIDWNFNGNSAEIRRVF